MSIGSPPSRSSAASHAACAASWPPAQVASSSKVMTRIADRPSPSSSAAAAPTAASTSGSPPAYSRRAPAPTASATSSAPAPRQPTVGSGPSAAADGTEMLDTSGSSCSCDAWLGSQPSQTRPVLCRPPPPPSTVTSIGMVAPA